MNRARLLVAALAVVIAGVVAVVVATSGGNAQTLRSTAPAGSAISLKPTSLGPVLVDANGRTLYLFEGDKPEVSTLSAAGQAVWPPFTSSIKPAALNGAVAADIGTTKGSGASAQITYSGHPLYYYVGDGHPGQTAGEGLNEFGARWYVLSSGGAAVTAPASGSSSTGSSASNANGSTYGY